MAENLTMPYNFSVNGCCIKISNGKETSQIFTPESRRFISENKEIRANTAVYTNIICTYNIRTYVTCQIFHNRPIKIFRKSPDTSRFHWVAYVLTLFLLFACHKSMPWLLHCRMCSQCIKLMLRKCTWNVWLWIDVFLHLLKNIE